MTILLSLINLGSTAALTAFFSLGAGSLLTSYTLCVGCLVWKRMRGETLPPRPWTLGRYGMGINIVSLCFLLMLLVWSFFPTATPVELRTMNWGVVIYGAIIIFATVYYFTVGKKIYTPPVDRVRRYL